MKLIIDKLLNGTSYKELLKLTSRRIHWLLVCAVRKLCSHSFFAKNQSDFLSRYKIDLTWQKNLHFSSKMKYRYFTGLICNVLYTSQVSVTNSMERLVINRFAYYEMIRFIWCQYDLWNSKISYWELESWTPTHLSSWIFLWWLCCSVQESGISTNLKTFACFRSTLS